MLVLKAVRFVLASCLSIVLFPSLAKAQVRADQTLFRAIRERGGDIDRLYTTSSDEIANAVSRLGYREENPVGRCFSQAYLEYAWGGVDRIPPLYTRLYRLYNNSITDRFYTINESERNAAIRQSGYVDEGVVCFVYRHNIPDSCELRRYWAARQRSNHFYTINLGEGLDAMRDGYVSEGREGYLPYDGNYCR
jgi:hypothetical protein